MCQFIRPLTHIHLIVSVDFSPPLPERSRGTLQVVSERVIQALPCITNTLVIPASELESALALDLTPKATPQSSYESERLQVVPTIPMHQERVLQVH